MIIEGMGGTISAESKLGEGAAFIIELPLAENKLDNENGALS
jgi:signal transduction histidine kinase